MERSILPIGLHSDHMDSLYRESIVEFDTTALTLLTMLDDEALFHGLIDRQQFLVALAVLESSAQWAH